MFAFNGSSWVQEQKLVPPVGAGGASFGSSVAVQNTVIVVGARTAYGTGAAYVFGFNGATWVDEDTLTATDAATNDRFGTAVDIDGDVIVVGSPENDDNGTNSGSFYVFRFQGGIEPWGDGIKITASDAAADEMFGWRRSRRRRHHKPAMYWDWSAAGRPARRSPGDK